MRNQIAKLFVLVIVTVVSVEEISADSYSVIDDVEVSIVGNNFKCDKMDCPSDADRCEVEKYKNSGNPSELIRKTSCLSKTGSILKSNSESSSIDPNSNASLRVVAYRDGNMVNLNTANYTSDGTGVNFNYDPIVAENMQKNLHHTLQTVQENIKAMNEQLQHQLQTLNNLKIFADGQ
ncbi:uncharacterized protein LOC119668146 isoform X2 [Teleopsis dalmanni]|uniref:uncharacterized protein LOC119668146 isoform X2 n=1 Tax=Teleopsis dalmanni TaxID=139649 RepID=UPI0018CD1431|nr:uncharacterized protein LOC119668146 isoform X2 [Teleopsis dalmanni]XP_037933487.1 uncharacterized protein LOC119668146 isoform X2 [Teleopsis dalmanni]XP_037933488.1 uncharacterized protein LOC119668146 isoform X2 [Teleopsis dalmanni]XP_037933489.1 uncharacterized protein LOC119668146 isoform X2 [Teleopsis dalmanni]